MSGSTASNDVPKVIELPSRSLLQPQSQAEELEFSPVVLKQAPAATTAEPDEEDLSTSRIQEGGRQISKGIQSAQQVRDRLRLFAFYFHDFDAENAQSYPFRGGRETQTATYDQLGFGRC